MLRSESSQERETSGARALAGIPGALSNQPAPSADEAQDETSPPPRNTSTDRVLNYEVDRTISRTKASQGEIQRLSVAVVLDYVDPLPDTGESVDTSQDTAQEEDTVASDCLLYTSPSPRDLSTSRMPSSA